MTEHKAARWRRKTTAGIAGVGMSVALMMGFGTATASADVLDELAEQYSTGAGAGQIANLLHTSLQLRAQGFKPKPADYQAIKAAMDRRPNQGPLVEALSAAVANQVKTQQQLRGVGGGQSPVVLGVQNQPWNPGNPMEWDNDKPFDMPGR